MHRVRSSLIDEPISRNMADEKIEELCQNVSNLSIQQDESLEATPTKTTSVKQEKEVKEEKEQRNDMIGINNNSNLRSSPKIASLKQVIDIVKLCYDLLISRNSGIKYGYIRLFDLEKVSIVEFVKRKKLESKRYSIFDHDCISLYQFISIYMNDIFTISPIPAYLVENDGKKAPKYCIGDPDPSKSDKDVEAFNTTVLYKTEIYVRKKEMNNNNHNNNNNATKLKYSDKIKLKIIDNNIMFNNKRNIVNLLTMSQIRQQCRYNNEKRNANRKILQVIDCLDNYLRTRKNVSECSDGEWLLSLKWSDFETICSNLGVSRWNDEWRFVMAVFLSNFYFPWICGDKMAHEMGEFIGEELEADRRVRHRKVKVRLNYNNFKHVSICIDYGISPLEFPTLHTMMKYVDDQSILWLLKNVPFITINENIKIKRYLHRKHNVYSNNAFDVSRKNNININNYNGYNNVVEDEYNAIHQATFHGRYQILEYLLYEMNGDPCIKNVCYRQDEKHSYNGSNRYNRFDRYNRNAYEAPGKLKIIHESCFDVVGAAFTRTYGRATSIPNQEKVKQVLDRWHEGQQKTWDQY